MTEPRSVKISDDERGAWSSDRPRREGSGPPREPDLSTRCRVLRPTDRMRYSPGSLVFIVSPSEAERERFLERVFVEEKGAVLSPSKIRELIAGRVPDDVLEEKATELAAAAALKRIEAGESTVVAPEGLAAEQRKALLQAASKLRRPRHMILLDVGRDDLDDEEREELNALRTALDAGELGKEGFQTAMRLGGATVGELKRVVFRPAPKDD
jgi:predicted kinase